MNEASLLHFDDHKRTKRTAERIREDCSFTCKQAFSEFQRKVKEAIAMRDRELEDIGEAEP